MRVIQARPGVGWGQAARPVRPAARRRPCGHGMGLVSVQRWLVLSRRALSPGAIGSCERAAPCGPAAQGSMAMARTGVPLPIGPISVAAPVFRSIRYRRVRPTVEYPVS